MEIDRERQAQALAKAKAIVAEAEKKREAARVEKGVQLFVHGNFEPLYNNEFVENLASYILNKFVLDEEEDAIQILEKLGNCLCNKKVELRERALMVVSVFTDIILDGDFPELKEILSRILVDWLTFETEYITGFEVVGSQLLKLILRMLYAEQWDELENIIITLAQISTGEIAKNNLIRGISAKVHENLAEPDILDKLTNTYLDRDDERHLVARSLLLHLGRFSAMFLVQKMIYSNNKEERFALIDLIPKIGEISIPVLKKCLEDEPPWFVIRNIVLIISRLENPLLFDIVSPYLTHRDIRVQQQVINCVEMLGGKQMRKRLIMALMQVNDELKGQLIVLLSQFEGMDIGNAFLDLLEVRSTLARHVQDDLILKLCLKLKFYPMKRTAEALGELVRERKERFGEADRIASAAASSLQVVGTKLKKFPVSQPLTEMTLLPAAETNDLPEADTREEGSHDGTSDKSYLFEELKEEEMQELSTTVDDGTNMTIGKPEKHEAGKETPSYKKQEHHLMIWSKFYEQMTTEEANNLFRLLTPVSYSAGEELCQQGTKQTDLFFIDSGFAGLSHIDEIGEVLITSLQAGDLIGSEGFIHGLDWSVSLTAQTDLHVRILKKEVFVRLEKTYPELAKRLTYYCTYYDIIPYLINQTEDETKTAVGSDIDVNPNKLIIDSDESVINDVTTGTLLYTAQGGYCFSLPFIHEDNAFAILGRQVSSDIEIEDGSERKCFGIIAGAGAHDQDPGLFYVYVKLYHPLEQADYACNTLEIM